MYRIAYRQNQTIILNYHNVWIAPVCSYMYKGTDFNVIWYSEGPSTEVCQQKMWSGPDNSSFCKSLHTQLHNCLFCCTVQWGGMWEFLSSVLWSCSFWWLAPHISKAHTAWPTWPLRRNAEHSFKMSGITQSATQYYIPEDWNPLFHPAKTSKPGQTVCVLSNTTASNINNVILPVSRTLKFSKLLNTLHN